MPANTDDLYTVVKNTSGADRFFGFLGRHGVNLAEDDSYSIFGLPANQEGWNARKQASFEAALLSGDLTLLNTPRPIMQDPDADAIVANPSVAATHSATGGGSTGGLLTAGKYKVAYTFVNAWGETTKGTSLSAALTVSAGNIPRVTLPALPTDADSISLYITNMHATTPDVTTLHRYATGITATTKDLTTDVVALDSTHPVPPATNTTAAGTVLAAAISDNVLGLDDPSMGRVTTELP